MSHGIDPAFGVRRYLLVDSMAWKVSIVINHAFRQACHGHHRLVSRTWSRLFLRRVIIEWPGLIGHQFVVIIGIHGIGKPVIVVSGIGYAGQYLAACRIRHDQRAGTRLQRQLARRNLQSLNLAP